MKQILLGTVALALATATSASAADLVPRTFSKAPPMAIAIYDWTGFYVGANGGWGSSRKCWDFRSPGTGGLFSEGCHDADGGVAGGQFGVNWQAGSWVFGLEAQGDWADLRGSNVSTLFPLATNRTRIDAIGLFTGRIGYAWNSALLYAKGGGAVARDKYDFRATGAAAPFSTATETRWGGTVGAGLEYGFAPSWSVAVEYDHLFLGRRDVAFAPPSTAVDSIRQDADLVTARINYRWNTPVLGKY
jgi:outer membrane immunogenic protein